MVEYIRFHRSGYSIHGFNPWNGKTACYYALLSSLMHNQSVFVFSQVFHNIMTEKYGFPIYVTYGFLAIFTVAFGLVLGLVCNTSGVSCTVCLVFICCPYVLSFLNHTMLLQPIPFNLKHKKVRWVCIFFLKCKSQQLFVYAYDQLMILSLLSYIFFVQGEKCQLLLTPWALLAF